jgi:asparaginyl-tRNA synthetase
MRSKIRKLKEQGTSLVGQEVSIKGWVRTVRAQKTFAFIEVNDGSTLSNLQVVLNSQTPGYEQLLEQLTTGCSVAITGAIVASPGKGQQVEIHAKEVRVLGLCDATTYPLQKKRHSFEFLREIAHLRPRTNTQGAVARVRHAAAFATHQFFHDRGFLYLHSPVITAADCEGAGQLFRVTTLDPDALPKTPEGRADYSQDFFQKPAYLTVSGQLNGEIYACALSDVYTFGPTFRAENSNTARHLAEFWMIEPEMAFADLNDDMDCAEAYLKYVMRYLLNHCSEDMAFFDQFVSQGLMGRLQQIVDRPFERLTYTEAIDILKKAPKKFEYPVEWGCDLQS